MDLSNITFKPLLDTLRLEDISDEEYFSEKFSDYISNSRLKLINPEEGGSPELFFEIRPKFSSPSLLFGSAVHGLTLQEESYEIVETVNRPTAKAGEIADLIYDGSGKMPDDSVILDACAKADYYKGNPTDNQMIKLKNSISDYLKSRASFESQYDGTRELIFLDEKSRERLHSCLLAIEDNKKIQELLHPVGLDEQPLIGGNEKTILLDVEASVPDKEPVVLRLKSKLDNYSIDTFENTICVNDLKTTGDMVNKFSDAIDKYHYYRELAMYSYMLSHCAKKFYNMDNISSTGNFLVVSTVPQYYTKVVPFTTTLLKRGFEEFKYLLRLVAYYKFYGY